jgi:hypothetical protein
MTLPLIFPGRSRAFVTTPRADTIVRAAAYFAAVVYSAQHLTPRHALAPTTIQTLVVTGRQSMPIRASGIRNLSKRKTTAAVTCLAGPGPPKCLDHAKGSTEGFMLVHDCGIVYS